MLASNKQTQNSCQCRSICEQDCRRSGARAAWKGKAAPTPSPSPPATHLARPGPYTASLWLKQMSLESRLLAACLSSSTFRGPPLAELSTNVEFKLSMFTSLLLLLWWFWQSKCNWSTGQTLLLLLPIQTRSMSNICFLG